MPTLMSSSEWHKSTLDSDVIIDKLGHASTNVLGRFRYHKRLDVAKSKAADEEIYRDVIICEEQVRGSKDISAKQLRSNNWKHLTEKFPDAWEQFNSQAPMEPTGTRLEEIGLSPEQITGLWHEAVRSVEDMAELPDPICERLGFGYKQLREKAKLFLKDAEKPKRGRPPKVKPENMEMIEGMQDA